MKYIAHYITRASGGMGAIREICDIFIAYKTSDFSGRVVMPKDLPDRWDAANDERKKIPTLIDGTFTVL